MPYTLINLSEVRRRIPRSRSTLYSEIRRRVFPKPIKLGRSSLWRDDEIEELIAAYAAQATETDLLRLCETFDARRRGQ